ncbi:hypothetical protein D9M70_510820 [compost metagenome]
MEEVQRPGLLHNGGAGDELVVGEPGRDAVAGGGTSAEDMATVGEAEGAGVSSRPCRTCTTATTQCTGQAGKDSSAATAASTTRSTVCQREAGSGGLNRGCTRDQSAAGGAQRTGRCGHCCRAGRQARAAICPTPKHAHDAAGGHLGQLLGRQVGHGAGDALQEGGGRLLKVHGPGGQPLQGGLDAILEACLQRIAELVGHRTQIGETKLQVLQAFDGSLVASGCC